MSYSVDLWSDYHVYWKHKRTWTRLMAWVPDVGEVDTGNAHHLSECRLVMPESSESWATKINKKYPECKNTLLICPISGFTKIVERKEKPVMFFVAKHLAGILKKQPRLKFLKKEAVRLLGSTPYDHAYTMNSYNYDSFRKMNEYILKFEIDFWKKRNDLRVIKRSIQKRIRQKRVSEKEQSFFQMILSAKKLSGIYKTKASA